jgi:cation diffusion facilitator family transporter
MNPQSISIISTFVNLGLGTSKLFFGSLIGSVALVADGIHSSLDVISSFVTFLGLKTAKKPFDKTHPYGYFKAESLAGFFVMILLAVTGIWILYEAVGRFFGEKSVIFSSTAISIVIISILVTELLARLKFKYGRKFQSLALVADAEHSRADALSSVGVLAGLFLVQYFSFADAIIALGIGGYILFEAFRIGKEITDSLLDVANKDLEEKIKKICASHKIEIAELKTRKIGAFNFAEIKIKLPPKLKLESVQEITKLLEERLLGNIPELKYIVISIETYEIEQSIILPRIGSKMCQSEGFVEIVQDEKISDKFGAEQYLVIDKRNNKILLNEMVKNPYFEKETPHGVRFTKAVRTDKVLTRQIGSNAKQNLENFGIEIEMISSDKNLNEILEETEKS